MILYFLDDQNVCRGTVTVENGECIGTGNSGESACQHMANLLDRTTGETVTPADGDRWLQLLQSKINSVYMRLVDESYMDEQGISKVVKEVTP